MMKFDEVREIVTDALMKEWFPNGYPGVEDERLTEDLENWKGVAELDSEAAVLALVREGLLQVSDSAKVLEMTKDERS